MILSTGIALYRSSISLASIHFVSELTAKMLRSFVRNSNATVDALRSVDINSYQLDKADIRLNTYIAGCIGNPEAHNLYELLAIRRFFYLLDKYDFRPGKVRRFIVFYEKLKFSGTKGLTRYKLTPVQVFQFANILGFYRPGTNKRLIRDALLFVPRKFSKTTSIASLAVFDLLFGEWLQAHQTEF